MKQKYNMDLAFVDLLFALLFCITVLFILAYLMINPIAKEGAIDPPAIMLVELEWPDDSKLDIDLWVRGHNNVWTGYLSKETRYRSLERDDLGLSNDFYYLNGKRTEIKRNYEVISFKALPAGEYFINAEYYTNKGDPVEVTITVTQVEPYRSVFKGSRTLTPKEQKTFVSFIVDENGVISKIRTDIQIPRPKETGDGP